jgi:hypothetical protein
MERAQIREAWTTPLSTVSNADAPSHEPNLNILGSSCVLSLKIIQTTSTRQYQDAAERLSQRHRGGQGADWDYICPQPLMTTARANTSAAQQTEDVECLWRSTGRRGRHGAQGAERASRHHLHGIDRKRPLLQLRCRCQRYGDGKIIVDESNTTQAACRWARAQSSPTPGRSSPPCRATPGVRTPTPATHARLTPASAGDDAQRH